MAVITNEIDKYLISYYTEEENHSTVSIHCLFNNSHKGTISFWNPNERISDSLLFGNRIMLQFYEKNYRNIVDILRNEKPLFLKYDDVKERGWLATTYEEIGQEEG